jgi:hypothetical protein
LVNKWMISRRSIQTLTSLKNININQWKNTLNELSLHFRRVHWKINGRKRPCIKKEAKVIEEGCDDIKDDIPEDIEKRLKDEESESRKKIYQEQKLLIIKKEQNYKAELNRRTQEKMEPDRKKQEDKIIRANET